MNEFEKMMAGLADSDASAGDRRMTDDEIAEFVARFPRSIPATEIGEADARKVMSMLAYHVAKSAEKESDKTGSALEAEMLAQILFSMLMYQPMYVRVTGDREYRKMVEQMVSTVHGLATAVIGNSE